MRCYAVTKGRVAVRVRVEFADGDADQFTIGPSPRRPKRRKRRLPQSVRDLLAVLDEGGKRMRACDLVRSLTDPPTDRKGELRRTAWDESTAWRALNRASALGLIGEREDDHGSGYGLVVWNGPQ